MLPPFIPHCVSDGARQNVRALTSLATHTVHPTRSLRALGLKPRTVHALRRAGVRSVPRLRELSEHELLLIPGIGHGSTLAIRSALACRSLSLDGDDDELI